jgi:type I restriction enzyme S subunit
MKYSLGDICTITKGETGIMKAIPGKYTMIALGEADKTHNEFQFDTKAVIIPLVSSTGHGHASMKRVKYQEGKFALGNILCAVIPKDESFVLAKYLHIYLHWNREELLVSQMRGMANVSLPMNKIADVLVTIPGIEKQKEIIDLEKKLVEKENEANCLFTDQLAQIENLNQAILQEAVQGKLVAQNKKDEPASELLKRIKAEKAALQQAQGKKEKPLPPIKPEEIPFEIPKGWVWCRLGEITNYGSSPKAEPSDLKNDTWVLDLEDIEKNTSDLLCKVRFNERNSLSTKSVFKAGDVLYSKLRPYLDKVIVADEDGVCTTEILPLKSFANLNPHYLKYTLKRVDFLKYVNSVTKGMKMPRLGTKEGEISLIPLPPLSEQKRIVAEIEKQLAKTKQLKEHIIANQQATEQLLKALLHGAFEVEGK